MESHEVTIDGIVYVPKAGQCDIASGWENIVKRDRMIRFDRLLMKSCVVRDSMSVQVWNGYTDETCQTPKYDGVKGVYALIVPCPNQTTAYALKELIGGVCAEAKAKCTRKYS